MKVRAWGWPFANVLLSGMVGGFGLKAGLAQARQFIFRSRTCLSDEYAEDTFGRGQSCGYSAGAKGAGGV